MSTIRVSDKTHSVLRELSAKAGTSMNEIVEQAVELYRRQRFVDSINSGYAELRADSLAWAAYQEELGAWDVTLLDGLEPDEATKPAHQEHA